MKDTMTFVVYFSIKLEKHKSIFALALK